MQEPEPNEECVCGHVYEEHRLDSKGVHECEVNECDCGMFESGGDDEEEDED